MMKVLGMDYGSKRIGIALGDVETGIAFPRETIDSTQEGLQHLKKIIRDENIKKIIIGLPLSLSGQETAQTRKTKDFASHLKQIIGLPIEFEDERFTTKLAQKVKQKRKAPDPAAAALILQSWLDRQSRIKPES